MPSRAVLRWKGFTKQRMLHTQEAGPGDAEVKRGKKKACTRKQRQRHERKLLLPEGGRWFPKEEPGTVLEGGTEKIQLA